MPCVCVPPVVCGIHVYAHTVCMYIKQGRECAHSEGMAGALCTQAVIFYGRPCLFRSVGSQILSQVSPGSECPFTVTPCLLCPFGSQIPSQVSPDSECRLTVHLACSAVASQVPAQVSGAGRAVDGADLHTAAVHLLSECCGMNGIWVGWH
jgi:hypothetical protein